MAYLRIATPPRITTPLTLGEATANIEALMALPQTRVLQEADGFWEVYREITGDVPARGDLVPDAHLATILRQHGIKTLATAERDFRKFSFLDVRDSFV
jgi:predicted nucleic acid-binding protein